MEFVTFEIAKKLKEKGFREKCLGFYTSTNSFYYNNTNVCSDVSDLLECCNESEEYDDIDAPTISQVLKWLREEKKIHIKPVLWSMGWYVDIQSFTKETDEDGAAYEDKFEYQSIDYKTYEEAVIAGVNYCLENLI